MDWLHVLTMIAGSTIGAGWYFKRDRDEKMANISRKLMEEIRDLHNSKKEFHERLCSLEERDIFN